MWAFLGGLSGSSDEKPSTKRALSKLTCDEGEDLSAAYDRLLAEFDLEQEASAAEVAELHAQHGRTMRRLRELRDEARRELDNKQDAVELALDRREKQLTLNLKDRIQNVYGTDERYSRLLTLRQTVAAQSEELTRLKKTYNDLVAKLGEQRANHARKVAEAARLALERQRDIEAARLKASEATFDDEFKNRATSEMRRLKAQLDGEGALQRAREVEAERRRQAAELQEARNQLTLVLEALPADESSRIKKIKEKEDRDHGPAVLRLRADVDRSADKLAGLLEELEGLEDVVRKARDDQAILDRAVSERTAKEKAAKLAELKRNDDELDKVHRDRLLRADAQARDQAKAAIADETARFDRSAVVRVMRGELGRLGYAADQAERGADDTEKRCRAEIDARKRTLAFERANVEAMRDALRDQADDDEAIAKTCSGVGFGVGDDDPSSARDRNDHPDDGDTLLLSLSRDASALREAVAEVKRELGHEREMHPIRSRFLEARLADKKREIDEAKERERERRGGDLSSKRGPGMPEALRCSKILKDWQRVHPRVVGPSAKTARPETLPDEKATALRDRAAIVNEAIGVIDDELTKDDDGARRRALVERRGVLEHEARCLVRLGEGSSTSEGGGFTYTRSQQPRSRVDASRAVRDANEAIDAAIVAQLELEATSGLDFERAPVEVLSQTTKGGFVDLAFPPRDRTSVYGRDDRGPQLLWLRGPQIFGQPSVPVVSGTIEPNDIKQGQLGDCWLMCALAAVAEFPELVQKCFPHRANLAEVDRNSPRAPDVYRVRICHGGLWVDVTLDDYFPCNPATRLPRFSRANGAELWVLLLEKALAKVNGGYFRLRAGLTVEGLMDITGLPTFMMQFKHPAFKKALADGSAFKHLLVADRNKAIACASTPGEDTFTEGRSARSTQPPRTGGLVPGHAYSLVSAVQVEGCQLVRLRNPWGEFEWQGAWSDGDRRWTPRMKRAVADVVGCAVDELGLDSNDGTFWMNFEDFVAHFRSFSMALQNSPSGQPWFEKRARGLLSAADPAELYRLTLTDDAHVFVGLHQPDERQKGAPANYIDLAITIARKHNGTLQFQDAAPPTIDRQLVCPFPTSYDSKWPAGDYVICAYTTGANFSWPTTQAWPRVYESRLMRPVTREIFTRFNTNLDGVLDLDELSTLLGDAGVRRHVTEARRLQRASADGVTERGLAKWLEQREDWQTLLSHLGYGPGPTPSDPPCLYDRCSVALAVHADAPIMLAKTSDDAHLIDVAQELPLLKMGTKHAYGDVDVYVLQSAKGISLLAKNTLEDASLDVRMDASKSKNCKSHAGFLDVSVRLEPGESKILHHLSAAKRGNAWGFTFHLTSRRV